MKNYINLILVIILAITGLATFQYNKIEDAKIEKAKLLYQVQGDFFFNNPKLSTMTRAIQENKPLLKINGGQFDEYDLDDYLGYFELMNTFVEEGVLPYNWINNQFGFYIKQAYKNIEINDYLNRLRKESTLPSYLYVGFEGLAIRIMNDDNTSTVNLTK